MQAEELNILTRRLEESAKQLGMQIGTEKIKFMRMLSSDDSDVSTSMVIKLETVTQFKYLGATVAKNARSVQEIKIKIAVATASLAKMKVI